MISYDKCPGCGQSDIYKVLTAEDFTVTHERFEIWECGNCSLRFTQFVPGPEAIGPYYQSETYISHSDTNKGIINRLYHKVRSHTLGQKRKMIETITGFSRGKILDLGCGTGAFLQEMKKSGWEVTGLEPDQNARKKAKELYQLSVESSDKLFALPPESFDAITMWHVLEHVHELHEYLDQLRQLLKPGGKLFIAVPNYTCHDEKVYKEFWAAYDVPRHLYHFSPASMKALLSLHSLRIVQIKPMWYDSFYVSMLSEKYKSGKSHLASAFVNGIVSNIKGAFDTGKCSSVIYVASPQLPPKVE